MESQDPLFILDVSGFLFRSYFALPPMTNPQGEATHALFGFIRSVLKLMKDFSPTHIAAVFDAPDAKKTRVEMYAEYKAHRKPIPEDLPQQIEWAKEFCKKIGIKSFTVPAVEADDTMGTIAKKMETLGHVIYLCTSDKDMCQLVGDKIFVLNTHKDNLVLDAKKVEETYGVKPSQIIDYLAIVGDASDNIPGLTGFGPKTASKLLQEFESLNTILDNFEKVPGKKKQETLLQEKEIALLSHQLATINIDIPLDITWDGLAILPEDLPALKEFYKQMGFFSLLKGLIAEKPQDETVNYILCDDVKSLESLVKTLSVAKEIAFDTETTDLSPMKARLVGIGFAIEPGTAWYIPCNGQLGKDKVLETLKPLFSNASISFCGHNIKYDWHVLKNEGLDIANMGFDTMVASYVLNAHERRHSLDALSLGVFGKLKTPITDLIGSGKKQIGMEEVPIEKVFPYCCEDVDYTCRLKIHFQEELKTRSLNEIMTKIEVPLIPVLGKMERHGIYLNQKTLEALSKKLHQSLDKIEEEIYTIAGKRFKLNSPKALSILLFEEMGIPPVKRTTTGFSTNAEVLETLSEKYPIAKRILSYRSLFKLLSTYIDQLPNSVYSQTGRIHCTFNQVVATTGRLSCQNPNLQNIPIRSPEGAAIRGAFEANPKNLTFISADYSQIELRLLAHFSEDPFLLEAFDTGQDVHAFTASLIFDVSLDKVTKQMRNRAKTVNFGIIYGQQPFGLARQIGSTLKEAKDFIASYFDRFSSVKSYFDRCKLQAKKTGVAKTLLGRERQILEINSRNAIVRSAAERLAINTPLQGSGADLIKLAMLKLAPKLAPSSKMLLQIHDELLFEVPEDQVKSVSHLVKTEMENAYPLKVPLVVDVSVGKNWKECYS